MRILTFLLAAGVLVSTVPLGAQSLADVAKQEQDRRKDVKVSSKAYSNTDLKAVPPPTQPAGAGPAADASAGSQSEPPASSAQPEVAQSSADSSAGPQDEKAETETKDRAYWAKRMQDSRDRLDRDRMLAEALQTRVNSLTTDFANRDDPAQQARIGLDRQKVLSELARLKKAAEADQLAIAALEEEARRAGVPPGWLR